MGIGDFLRHRRTELDISLSDLATRLALRGFSTTKANIGHWERGRTNPPLDDPDFRMALAASLEMSVNDLMRRLGYTTDEDSLTSKAMRAAEIVNRLPEDAQDLALDLLEQLERRYA